MDTLNNNFMRILASVYRLLGSTQEFCCMLFCLFKTYMSNVYRTM
jgi:hypothetical protein